MLIKGAAKLVARGTSAQRAIWESGSSVSEMLHNLGGYMAERATDILDVRARIVAELRGVPAPGIPSSETPFILVAEDLAPADTATLDPNKVLALVTAGGGPQSHTAIIARSLGLPAVVAAVGVDELPDGTEVYVDGAAGTITAEPGRLAARRGGGLGGHGFPPGRVQRHGHDGGRPPGARSSPTLAAAKDAEAAAKLGAQGVGLFRTEFCFLERDTEPSVEEQAAAYKGVFDAFPGKKVVLRTLDAGADKPLPFLTDSTEPNPALGVRGYRTDFTTPGRAGPPAGGHRPGRKAVRSGRLGHGSDDFDGGGSCPVRLHVRRGRHQDARRDGGGPVRRPHRRRHPARGRLRQPGHQRPHPVRHGRRPPARPARRPEHARGSRPCCASWG